MRYPSFIRQPAVMMVGERCFSEIAEKFHFDNAVCWKHVVSKGLGFLIVLGGAIVKLPQIYKIVASGSVAGLSLPAFIMETVSMSISVSYNYRNQNPFSTYGESFFLLMQNFVILLLMFLYLGRLNQAVLAAALFTLALYLLNSPTLLNGATMALLQTATIPISLTSRVPQILANYRNGSTGQLAAFTVLNSFIGCLVRVFTTLQEVNDPIILAGFLMASCLHGTLAFQMLYYWNAKQPYGKDPFGMSNDKKKVM
ncbi:hypothetical protein IWQ62_002441 [Dispira parvispora]|uniref:Mannose-P-dolichol utilization defect 1 protein homolog n=1 Tax=Dispira parvispora TaxID=1520584 RepID=A0A9W8E2P1_9FUNG|nr:hypothetical protein IWQ62_002441 [Dispira parvispora]